MKLIVSLIAILFCGSVLLVNAAADVASDARPKTECKAAHDGAPGARC